MHHPKAILDNCFLTLPFESLLHQARNYYNNIFTFNFTLLYIIYLYDVIFFILIQFPLSVIKVITWSQLKYAKA